MAEIPRRALLSRAALFAGAVAGIGLGAGKGIRHKKAVPPAPPPAELVGLREAERNLLASYDAALLEPAARPLLSALRADVAAHVEALGAVLETYPGWRLARSASPTPASGAATPGGATSTPSGGPTPLPAASSRLAASAGRLCTTWPAADPNAATLVPLLGSISACLQTHAQMLA